MISSQFYLLVGIKKLTFYCIGSNTLYPNIFEIILHFEKKPKLRILESGFIDKNLHVVQSIYYITTYYKVPRGKLMNIYFMRNNFFLQKNLDTGQFQM